MAKRRVVVTGVGIVSPVGSTVETAWTNILAGRSGIGPITTFDVSGFPVRIGGSVKDFQVEQYLNLKEAKKMDTFIHYGIGAAVQAIRDSGLVITEANAERIGIYIGSGIGGLPGIEEGHSAFLKGGPRRLTPFFVPRSIINMVSGNLSILYGIKGPNLAVVTACTTGTHSIGLAGRLITYGDADVMIAGGAEMATTPTGLCGFAAARALSVRNDEPEKASRPWDRDRDGFVLSDGAGVIVLEEYEHARRRGARDPCRADRVRHERRRLPYDAAAAGWRRCPAVDGECPARRGDRFRRGGLHQRARHVHASRRQDRKRCGESGVRGARLPAGDEFDQVDDGSPAGCGRRC